MSFRTSFPVLGFAFALTGCAPNHPAAQDNGPTPVTVSYPVERDVTDHVDFTARTEAQYTANVTARATGDLTVVRFKEGDIVHGGPWGNPTTGDLLAVIDQRPYQAAYDQAAAQVKVSEATLALARATLAIDQNANSRGGPGVVTDLQIAQDMANVGVGDANLRAAQAALETAGLNLRYTEVRAPFTGRVGRRVLEIGNPVVANQTMVANVVSVDPMYAYFDVDEYTALRVRQLVREGKSDSPRDGGYAVSLALANEDGYPHQGTINFVNNQVNPKTGTIRVRGVFPNKEQILLPGLFARVRVPIGRAHKALLVSDRALDTDQGQKILYFVDRDNKVVARPVRLGDLHDGLREVLDGVQSGERVIVNGLQQIRPGLAVEPTVVQMPSGRQMSEVRGQK